MNAMQREYLHRCIEGAPESEQEHYIRDRMSGVLSGVGTNAKQQCENLRQLIRRPDGNSIRGFISDIDIFDLRRKYQPWIQASSTPFKEQITIARKLENLWTI